MLHFWIWLCLLAISWLCSDEGLKPERLGTKCEKVNFIWIFRISQHLREVLVGWSSGLFLLLRLGTLLKGSTLGFPCTHFSLLPSISALCKMIYQQPTEKKQTHCNWKWFSTRFPSGKWSEWLSFNDFICEVFLADSPYLSCCYGPVFK